MDNAPIPTQPTANVPATITTQTLPRGMEEGVSSDEITIPRAALLQGLSPQIKEDDTLRAGQIVNSLTLEILPSKFVPIRKSTSYARFNPRKKDDPNFNSDFEPAATIWRTNDPSDPRVIQEACWGPNGEPPLAIRFMNFLCLFPGVEMPVFIGFARTSFKAGKKLNSLIMFSSKGSTFIGEKSYELGVMEESNPSGDYYVYTVKPAGVTEKKDLEQALQWFEMWSPTKAEAAAHDVDAEAQASGKEDDMPF